MIQTACPLDCWDACGITVDPQYPDKLVATEDHPTSNGALCALTKKHIHEEPRIIQPRIEGREVSMDEALDAVAEALAGEKSLLWRGSGNLGVMQQVTDLLMERIGGTLTSGSLCDSAGQAGVEAGRGINRILPPEQIAQSEVVVIWGRNLTVTNKHLLPYLESKKLIVIDPVRTKIAKQADIHLQIKPRTDLYLALLLARFSIMEDGEDHAWLEAWGSEWEEFYEFTREFRIKAILAYMDLSLDKMGDMLHLIQAHRTVFLIGIPLQHHRQGHATVHAIDSLAAILGLFGREGCGVSYMGNSRQGFDNPFDVSTLRVPMVTTPFASYDTVLVQGGNPAASMPDSTRVESSLKSVNNLIYFGLYENETSALARIVIPAKSFLEKEDIRLSYSHQYVTPMRRVVEGQYGISEYDFTDTLLKKLGRERLESETAYLARWLDQCQTFDHHPCLPDFDLLPYAGGFGEGGDEEFVFVDEYEDENEPVAFRRFRKPKEWVFDGHYYLLTPKSLHALNSQFVRQAQVHVPPSAGFSEEERVYLSNEWGTLELTVKLNDDLREDCVLVYASTPGVNRLTPPYLSDEGEGACYSEAKVRIERAE
jgi:anaerobic selenocysteine-containing dehydrogenase